MRGEERGNTGEGQEDVLCSYPAGEMKCLYVPKTKSGYVSNTPACTTALTRGTNF